jgi:cullin-5
MAHQEDQALLKAYISSWRKFFIQCSYLPMPFHQLELALLNKPPTNNAQKKSNNDESIVRKVYIFWIKLLDHLIKIKINLIE